MWDSWTRTKDLNYKKSSKQHKHICQPPASYKDDVEGQMTLEQAEAKRNQEKVKSPPLLEKAGNITGHRKWTVFFLRWARTCYLGSHTVSSSTTVLLSAFSAAVTWHCDEKQLTGRRRFSFWLTTPHLHITQLVRETEDMTNKTCHLVYSAQVWKNTEWCGISLCMLWLPLINKETALDL